MKERLITLIGFFIVLTISWTGYYFYQNIQDMNETESLTCLDVINTDNSGSLDSQFEEFVNDNELKPLVVGTKKTSFVDLESVKDYTINDKTVAWVDNKNLEIVFDKTYFKELILRDATSVGNTYPGVIHTKLLDEWGGRKIANFLLESQVINTYWHMGAVLCLAEEDDNELEYVATYQGTHEYFTNERNVEELNFKITISKENGELLLEVK